MIFFEIPVPSRARLVKKDWHLKVFTDEKTKGRKQPLSLDDYSLFFGTEGLKDVLLLSSCRRFHLSGFLGVYRSEAFGDFHNPKYATISPKIACIYAADFRFG
jgi:hypothetical protein